jgi:hypothetical protein
MIVSLKKIYKFYYEKSFLECFFVTLGLSEAFVIYKDFKVFILIC